MLCRNTSIVNDLALSVRVQSQVSKVEFLHTVHTIASFRFEYKEEGYICLGYGCAC